MTRRNSTGAAPANYLDLHNAPPILLILMGHPHDPQLIPPGKRWSHDPGGFSGDREESAAYQLPQSEVLPWLMLQTDFLQDSSSEANDRYRGVIYGEQYPQLHGEIRPRHRGPQPDWSAQKARDDIESFVRRFAFSHLGGRHVAIGFTPVLREHVYSDGVVTLPNAIVLGLPMRYAETNAAPEPKAGEEVTRNYMELGSLTLALGDHLRNCGYSAEIHHPRGDENANCEALYVPHAIAAGLGDLGRHGSMISRDFGPRVRLSMITTDAPIPAPALPRAESGIAEFCTWCTKCLAACPVDAIEMDRITLRGSYRHVVNTTKCLPYFAATDGCGICIAVCPYNKPDESQSREFHDGVLAIDWVQEAIAIKQHDGVRAMEQFVQSRKKGKKGNHG